MRTKILVVLWLVGAFLSNAHAGDPMFTQIRPSFSPFKPSPSNAFSNPAIKGKPIYIGFSQGYTGIQTPWVVMSGGRYDCAYAAYIGYNLNGGAANGFSYINGEKWTSNDNPTTVVPIADMWANYSVSALESMGLPLKNFTTQEITDNGLMVHGGTGNPSAPASVAWEWVDLNDLLVNQADVTPPLGFLALSIPDDKAVLNYSWKIQ